MRVLWLLSAATAIFALIDGVSAQYARPTFDDDDDFGYVPPAAAVTQKPALQPIRPQGQPDLVDIKVRPEPEAPRRVTIRRRKKPTPPPETQVVSTPPREETLQIVPQTPPRSTPSSVPAIAAPISGIGPLNQAPIATAPVTQPPGNFMFMRIGGYGFDNGEVPTGIEPPKQMLPELVPAGVRVRTPSGVVVSVRGQPGLYGIHPTPPPDASHGPRKPAPKPEIVYLTQKPTPAPQPLKTIPISPIQSVPKAPTVPYTQGIRAERPPAQVRVASAEPIQGGDVPSRSPGRYIQSPQPLFVPQTGVTARVPITTVSRPILRQTVPRGPPRIFIENAFVGNQPGSTIVPEVPIIQIPSSGQFGQRLRPLTRVNSGPAPIDELATPGVGQLIPSQSPPRRFQPQTERQRLTQGIVDVPQQRPGSIGFREPGADLRPTRPGEPKSRVFSPSTGAIAEPVDIKEPNVVRIANSNPLETSDGVERSPVGPAVQVTYAPAAPRVQTFIDSPVRTQRPQVVLVRQPPVGTLVDEQPPISGGPIQYGSPVAQQPRIVLQQPVVIPNVEIQRIVSPAPINVQQNVGPKTQRVPVRPPSSIPPNFNQQVPLRRGNDQQIIIGQNVPTRANVPQRSFPSVSGNPKSSLDIQSSPPEVAPDQRIVIGPNVPTRINVPQRNIQTPVSGVPQNNRDNRLTPLGVARGSLRPVSPVIQKAVVTQPLLDQNREQQENPNGFSFMRIGGFGFDNGVVPARFNVEPAKEMLPELVPAGVRVRTPSGVVVSVRGRPGLYGIHPTPAPDTSFGPTKKPPRPEIVYLQQTTPRPKSAPTAKPSLVVPLSPLQYGTPVLAERPARIPAAPLNVIEQPQRVVEQPPRIVEQPPGVVQQPLRFVEQPLTIIEQPQRVAEQPLRIVKQPSQVPVVPQLVFTQVPQRVVTQVPQRLIPQRVVVQVPQSDVTQVPQTFIQPQRQRVVEEPQRNVRQPQRVVEQPLRIVEQPRQVVEQPQRVVEQPRTVVEQPQRVVEQPQTVVEQPLTIIEQPRRVVEQPQRVVEQPQRVVEQPLTVIEQPQRVVEQPQRVVEQPLTIIEQPRRVVEQPQSVVEQPLTIIEQPRRVIEQPLRIVEQPIQVPVAPQLVFTQEPRRVIMQVPQRVLTQVPQQVLTQVPQRVLTQVPQRVIAQVPQTVKQPVQPPQAPIRAILQPPQAVSQIPRRDSAVIQGPQTLVSSTRPSPPQESLPVRPRIELQRVDTPSAAKKAPSTGSGSYGNDLSDFEDFEPSPEQKQQPTTASRETRVSSGSVSAEPKVVARDVSQSENANGVNLSSTDAGGPVNVVIGNIEEGPYNFHHRHTHGNGFAFVKLGVPFYQKMEADIVAAAGPPVYSRPAFQGDGSGVVVKKSRRKSS